MSHEAPSVSVVVPVHNEVDTVDELRNRIGKTLKDDFEIIFVDDGSTDGSREKLVELAASDERVEVIGFRRNFGKSHALTAGFKLARGRFVVTIDGDLQDDPNEIPSLIAELEGGADLVGGWRKNRQDPKTKILSSQIFNGLVRLVAGVRFRDMNCGLKAMRREVVETLELASGYHRFLPLLAHWKGFRVQEKEVVHHPREHGSTSYGRSRGPRAIMDLFVLVFLERFEGRPGKYLAGTGALGMFLGLAMLIGLFVLQRATGSIQSRFPMLATAFALIVIGVQLLSLGFMAELLAYHFRSRRPREPAFWSGDADDQDRVP